MAQAVAAQRLDHLLEHSPDAHIMRDMLAHISEVAQTHAQDPPPSAPQDALLVLLPLLIVLSTFLFLLLLFLVCVLLMRRRRGIMLREHDGPVDMSREELVEGEGGFEGVESRWLESVGESVRREYLRAKEHQLQYAPNSLPTDITLSQFLSIQEKGVSAWCFEPDFDTLNSLLVHARTEITFLPDPASSSCVQSNLPLPKLNEVYYWEVKMFDLPVTTNVAIGLATKPYPTFRLPGWNRYSVAYHSNGDKSHNYPFTATSFGPQLKEGDVLGVGYRPRTGTVFFTRNGRKTEDAFVGLSRWNLFPTIGADGPCSVHVNLGQSGFVFIEANVKKWGLAPSVGTLAPPPAYGSERGSILLDVGGGVRPSGEPLHGSPGTAISPPPRRSHRSRLARRPQTTIPAASSPLRTSDIPPIPLTPPPPITPIEEDPDEAQPGPSNSRYISPSDLPFHTPPNTNLPPSPGGGLHELDETRSTRTSSPMSSTRSLSPDASGASRPSSFSAPRRRQHSFTHMIASLNPSSDPEHTVQVHPPPESPMSPNPPTPNHRDIHLQALSRPRNNDGRNHDELIPPDTMSRRDPPAYSPLDAYTYSEGVHIDLPAEVIAAALEGNSLPASIIGQGTSSRSDRRNRRR
ncbi:Rsp5p-dependent ubiquitination, sorting of cargo proteins at the multivesicular body [Pleurotus pulmonarius]|nr:Rsp5p-dependent ubiquitination, sorting of cargo proteins at the multivesicular body [Pleurotus pulmonarius]KAF4606750.1 Rsp5p-dependent ubiquitination, sorting of cargo proteins at the multivesicular body [Pleurotus pulmonarius]